MDVTMIPSDEIATTSQKHLSPLSVTKESTTSPVTSTDFARWALHLECGLNHSNK